MFAHCREHSRGAKRAMLASTFVRMDDGVVGE
jgi:hypothetical protein